MLSTPHLLVGAAIAKAVPNPLISLPASFASHFLFDSIPHWDGSPRPPFGKNFYLLVALDYLFGLSLVWVFGHHNSHFPIIFIGAFLATLPDFMLGSFRNFNLPWNKWAWYSKLNDFHRKIQSNVTPLAGLTTSALAVVISILILAK